MKATNLILAAFLFFGAAIAQADDVIILERTARDFDTWGATPNGRERVLAAISRETGISVTTLEAQRAQTRLGYGGLFIANSLASATGRTFEEIAALKASGQGWGSIAKQNNVKLGPIVSRARHANKQFKHDNGKVKKLKKNKDDSIFNDDSNRFDRGPGNSHGFDKSHGFEKSHGFDKGPKSNASFHSKGKGKGR